MTEDRLRNSASSSLTDHEALDRFVSENHELVELEALVARFNIFEALGIVRAELRHSDFLGWLLDPSESHGQGDVFLRPLLMDLLRYVPSGQRPVSLVAMDGAQLDDVEVRREWKHIDLLIHGRSPRFVIVIENKMHGFEVASKLQRYEEAVRAEFPNTPALFVFLNPEGEDAPDNRWFAYSYSQVHEVLRRVQRATKGALGTDVSVFLEHYLSLLETRFMESPKIIELCRQIYRNHKKAIDLIHQHALSGADGLLGDLAHRLEGLPDWKVITVGGGAVRFVPSDWLNVLPQLGEPEDGPGRAWLTFRISTDGFSLKMRVSTRSVSDDTARNQFLERLWAIGAEEGFKPSFATWKTQKRVSIWSEKIANWEEGEETDPDLIFDRMMVKARQLAERMLPLLKQASRA